MLDSCEVNNKTNERVTLVIRPHEWCVTTMSRKYGVCLFIMVCRLFQRQV